MSTYLSVGLCRGGVNWRLADSWAAARVFPLVGISGGTGEMQGFLDSLRSPGMTVGGALEKSNGENISLLVQTSVGRLL